MHVSQNKIREDVNNMLDVDRIHIINEGESEGNSQVLDLYARSILSTVDGSPVHSADDLDLTDIQKQYVYECYRFYARIMLADAGSI